MLIGGSCSTSIEGGSQYYQGFGLIKENPMGDLKSGFSSYDY